MVAAASPVPSSALRLPGFRAFLVTNMLAMMADNIEHVISYWVCYQKFHSSALAGFAVVSHWLPFLLLSVAVGALNDRYDSRRIVQVGMLLFIVTSLGWGYAFVTDTLTMPFAMALLICHGCAGVLWSTSNQMLLYSIAGPAHLQSAVRLNSTFRYLGILIGPAVGGAIMQLFGPSGGIFVNTLFYLPLLLWLVSAPYGPKFQRGVLVARATAVRGLADILASLREVRTIPVVLTMTLLAGGASFLVGNSYHAQMPGFAQDLGRAKADVTYSILLAADAAGALLAGVILERRGGILKTEPGVALRLAGLWGASLAAFAVSQSYTLAIVCLFMAGFFELSFSSVAQTLVQLNAPDAIRGRVIGLYSMSAFGLRTFSGITVGLLGSLTSIHVSLFCSALTFALLTFLLSLHLHRQRVRTAASG